MKRRKINYEDYIGKTINHLTILGLKFKGTNKNRYFLCKCSCGTIKDVRAIYVIDELIKSCGCRKNEKLFSKENIEKIRQIGKSNRKHEEKCDYCGANNHFARGLCHNCYERYRRNGELIHHKRGCKSDRKPN